MKTKLKKIRNKISTAFVLSLATFSTASAVQEGGAGGSLGRQEDCPAGTTCNTNFRGAVVGFINYFLAFLGLLAVLMIVYAGILMVTAQGDEEQAGKGKTIIMWAGVGIVIILLSYTIVGWFLGSNEQAA